MVLVWYHQMPLRNQTICFQTFLLQGQKRDPYDVFACDVFNCFVLYIACKYYKKHPFWVLMKRLISGQKLSNIWYAAVKTTADA